MCHILCAGADVQGKGPSPSRDAPPMTWLDYAAAPPTPAPSRGGRTSDRLSGARAWDESPMVSLVLPGDPVPSSSAAGRPAEEAREDGGPAAKRSHWDVQTPPAQATSGFVRTHDVTFPPSSPAAGAGAGLWGADVAPPTPTPSRAQSAGLPAWPEFPDVSGGGGAPL